MVIPTLGGGGAERVTVNLANELAVRGYSIDVVLAKAIGDFINDLHADVRVVNLKVERLREVFLPLSHYLRQTKPAAILACMWPLSVIALCARRFAHVNARVVVAEHTTWSRDPALRSPASRWLARTTMYRTFPWANGVVAVSQGAADDLARFSGLARKRVSVIYNPVVGAPRPPTTMRLNPLDWWSGAHRRVLAVGTLNLRKDYVTLLTAFAHLCQHADVRLLILGEGECRCALEAQSRLLGLEGILFMPGFVRNPSPYFQRADLLVLSSTCEALPTVIIEALAAGTPVVSTDCPSGPREILSDGRFGSLIPVGDATALAAAMAGSLTATHDKAALTERAQDFSIEKAADQYEKLLVGR
jgi:glycosyltransferase involved in cell wall biosynthesis